jgi:hypothetical protein
MVFVGKLVKEFRRRLSAGESVEAGPGRIEH